MNIYISSAVMSALLLAQPAYAAGNNDTHRANTKADRSFRYYIPKTKVVAQIKQRITKCEVIGGKLDIAIISEASIKAGTKADYERAITINGKSGFLVNRSTKLTLNNDGTLKSFNGSSTGQGGALLSAVIQTAAIGASLTVNPSIGASSLASAITTSNKKEKPTEPIIIYVPKCNAEIINKLTNLKMVNEKRSKIRNAIANGQAGLAMQEELVRIASDIDNLHKSLTITASVDLTATKSKTAKDILSGRMLGNYKKWVNIISKPVNMMSPEYNKNSIIEPIGLDKYLQNLLDQNKKPFILPGIYGFRLAVDADKAACAAIDNNNCVPTETGSTPTNSKKWAANKDFFYVRPIPAEAKFYACADDECTKSSKVKGTSAKTNILLPQLSKLYSISTGASIFGSRTVAATFGPYGEPLTLEYTKGGGGAEIASVITAAGSAATTIDGARLQATQDQIARINAERELDILLNSPDSSGE